MAITDLLCRGEKNESRNGPVLDVIGWSMTLPTLDYTVLMNKTRNISPQYAAAELLWYLSGTYDASMIKHYAPQYENFTEPGTNIAYGAYGGRLNENVNGFNQLQLVVRTLKNNRHSRQAVVSLWRPCDLLFAVDTSKRDLPCTLTWQFMIRNDKLHLITSMRSNDVWLGMPYDIFCNTCIQRLVANELGVGYGTYTHNVGNLHIYEKHLAAARGVTYDAPKKNNWSWNFDNFTTAQLAVECEQQYREGKPITLSGLGSMMTEMMYCIMQDDEGLNSPSLLERLAYYVDSRRSRPGGKNHAV